MRLTPPIRMPLEKALAYIQDDELVEVTPKSIRLRKRYLGLEREEAHGARGGFDGGERGLRRISPPENILRKNHVAL